MAKQQGHTSLHLACLGGHVDVVGMLLEQGAILHATDLVRGGLGL